MARNLAEIDQTVCVACGCCCKVCPRDAVSILHGVYAQVEAAQCVGCGICSKACPADVITLHPREVAS